MAEITLSAKTFVRLFDYLQRIGLDVQAIAAAAELRRDYIAALDPEEALPAAQYSRLYKAAATEMQQLKQPLPWGAGLGGESFELMCHCIIGARTLGAALRLAERFNTLLFPLNRYRMSLLEEPPGPQVRLAYNFDMPLGEAALLPEGWHPGDDTLTVARASGLTVWHAFSGWLIGQNIKVEELRLDAPALTRHYQDSLLRIFDAPIHLGAGENSFSFEREILQRRVVHTTESLEEFLKNSVYHLLAMDRLPTSTSSAIKSLVTIDMPNGMPSFSSVASMLYMSESSLRRRLQSEHTSYQAIKDEVRCEVAIDKLLHEDTRIADLAEYLGFTEASSFVRSFKGWTGHTPKSYKEKMQTMAGA